MIRRSQHRLLLLACVAIAAGFLSAAPAALATEHVVGPPQQPKMEVDLQDTGKTIALSIGEELVVALPLKTYNDNTWYIYRNSGVPLKLIAGPNELRGRNFKPWTRQAAQLFYFRKEAPGTTHLVLEQNYWSKPMILKVVDGPPLPPPPPPGPPPPPHATAPTERVVLRGIHFDFNKSVIRPGDAAVLDEDVSKLKANPNLAVYVNGYCDAIGSEEYNLKLSDRRANAVVKYLVKAGVSESQLIPHGYGKTDFVSTNDTEEGRAQNRRVELVPND
jgi:outer membrane protein OmpA-like peptidoglycan-associated protein